MKSIFNRILFAGAAAAICFSCTNLDETLYSDISSETHEMSETELAATIAPVYGSLRDVCWAWFGSFDLNDMSSDVWGVPNRIGIGWVTSTSLCTSTSSTARWTFSPCPGITTMQV